MGGGGAAQPAAGAGLSLAGIGAGTGAFASAFGDWFGIGVLAIEPSAAMRARIPRRAGIELLGRADILRAGDTTMRDLTEEEFSRGGSAWPWMLGFALSLRALICWCCADVIVVP